MLASPLPIYLGCAGLIVGSLGLGANHMLGGGSGPSTNKDAAMEQPLFAKSVEQASLPTTEWPSKNVDVAYYGPMVELLTQPTASVPAPLADPSRVAATQETSQGQQPPTRDVAPASQSPSTTAHVQEQPRAAPREVVRDLSPRQSRQSRRPKNQHQRDDARAGRETASTEQVDPRETRAQERQRTATQVDTERRAATAIAMTPTRSMRDPARTAGGVNSKTVDSVTANGAWSCGKKSGSRSNASCACLNSAGLNSAMSASARSGCSASSISAENYDPFLETSG
jgi:hypothetical protein